jgi:hypothetical protein
MARGLFSMKTSGLKEFIAEMNGLAEKIPEISKQALQSQQKVVENKIKENWVSMVGGSSGGLVYSSIGQSTSFSNQNSVDVVGTVGVYKIDSVPSSLGLTELNDKRKKRGKKKRVLNAAQIAYWVEFGTSRLRSGTRSTKGLDYNEEELIQVGPKPFISNAFYSSLDEQQNAFKLEFNRLADQLR